MPSKKKIFIAGHNGMIGSAILRKFKKKKIIKYIIKKKTNLILLNKKMYLII